MKDVQESASAFQDSARCLRIADALSASAQGKALVLDAKDLERILQIFTRAVAWHTTHGKGGSITGELDSYILLIKCQNHGSMSGPAKKGYEGVTRMVSVQNTLQKVAGGGTLTADQLNEAAQLCRLLSSYLLESRRGPIPRIDENDD